MQHEYDIIIRGTIEFGSTFTADSLDAALDAAKLELRGHGQIDNIVVERAVMLDPLDGGFDLLTEDTDADDDADSDAGDTLLPATPPPSA